MTGELGSTAGVAVQPQPSPPGRSLLGLGPLETEIMQAVWEAGDWLTIRDIRARMASPRAYTTVATVIGVLCGKDLLHRRPADWQGRPGKRAWCYRAARPVSEYIGELIAGLLSQSPDPGATLTHALATTQAASLG